ncbi:Adenine deaminase, partial [hydrothermal vent metagenome]
MKVQGQIVDIKKKRIFPGEVIVEDGKIKKITKLEVAPSHFIMPGFVDAHIHIESSLLVPTEFARMAVVHGTVATVSDPHEIGNVLGTKGVLYMIENGEKVPFKFNFGAPSCVPATTFETAGAEIDTDEVDVLLADNRVKYLAEMMNWPGVLFSDKVVHAKIKAAQKYGKPVDGHAPGLMGEQAEQYVKAGMSTDHECFTAEEALGKLELGMKVQIREGSAARNFDALYPLLENWSHLMMFCSDDKHPDNLEVGHINELAARAIAKGIDVFKVLHAACINPVEHYKLDVGLLKEGDNADFIIVNNLEKFISTATYINGELVAKNGQTLIERQPTEIINQFDTALKIAADFELKAKRENINVIEAFDGQLITKKNECPTTIENGKAISNTETDVLKMAVINRYSNAKPAVAFIKNFGLKEGAIASSVGHDSHNITVVGVDDESIAKAVNLVIEAKGGLSAVSSSEEIILPLPVAGLMSDKDGYQVSKDYTAIDQLSKKMGATLKAPFMTLSFMALLVIPSIKLSDLG